MNNSVFFKAWEVCFETSIKSIRSNHHHITSFQGESMHRRSLLVAGLWLAIFCIAEGISTNTLNLDAAILPGDWPQWRGPNRDGISNETGLLKSWPATGPKVLWRASSGEGYSGMSVAQGRLYTVYGQSGNETAFCLDANTGKEIWRAVVDKQFDNDQGGGSRSTPTVDGDLVYVLSARGRLMALNTKDGQKAWEHNLVSEYGGRVPTWGISVSPLVEGNMLLVDVGGKSGHSVMAFNKGTGVVIWKSETDIPGYSAPIAVDVNGVRQILVFTGSALVSLSPAAGKLFWRYPWETRYDVNAATPVFIPGDKVFISSGYGKGGALLQMQPTAKSHGARVAKPRHEESFLVVDIVQNNLYGFDDAFLTCLDAATGEPRWQQRGFQKGSLLYADGHFIVLGERGNLALVEATPAGYKEKASFQILEGKCWTMPTLANGKLYARNQSEMLCVDVTGKN
jgi:outer membrane protein assembly factor BamB